MLALGFQEGQVMLVDEVTGKVRWAVQAHAEGAKVAMSPSGRFVASVASPAESWKLWDASGALWMDGARRFVDGRTEPMEQGLASARLPIFLTDCCRKDAR